MTKDRSGVGRIPFTFRVGVTGHRTLEHPAELAAAVVAAFGRLREEIIPEPARAWLVPVVVSALAEGADRLVADAILDMRGARLEVALPLPPEDYLNDFKTEQSKAEFLRLLGKATEIWQAPPSSSRDEAYERAGLYIADRCDALIALWDGEPSRGRGGTGAIVEYARAGHVPLVRVSTKGGAGTMVYEPGPERTSVVQDAAHKLLRYDADHMPAKAYDAGIRAQRTELALEEPSGTDTFDRLRRLVADWLIPYFVRADSLALRLQRRFRRLTTGMFVMAAAAVVVVAVQVNFFVSLNWLVALEVALLLCLVGLPLLNRRWQLHDKWISCRFLAERLRSAYYLTLAGTGDRQARAERLDYFSDSSETWIERALSEVLAHRPASDLTPADLSALKEYLGDNWIGRQICYHETSSMKLRLRDSRLIRVTTVLFGITLVAAFVHMLGWGEQDSHRSHPAVLLIVLSISVPAIGAAVHGIGTLREYRRNSDRYARMAKLLTKLQQEMLDADSLERVRALAAQTEQVMREENSDWFGVMRFHDMELIT
jgi:hypothetical protein